MELQEPYNSKGGYGRQLGNVFAIVCDPTHRSGDHDALVPRHQAVGMRVLRQLDRRQWRHLV